MPEPQFQISEKVSDTAILVVRGENYNDFTNNITALTEDKDFSSQLHLFLVSVNGQPPSHQQAVNNVLQMPAQPIQQHLVGATQTQTPWQQHPAGQQQQFAPQQQQYQQPQAPQGQFTCPHGQREYREGRSKNGGKWAAYFCTQKGSDCKPMNADGSFWR